MEGTEPSKPELDSKNLVRTLAFLALASLGGIAPAQSGSKPAALPKPLDLARRADAALAQLKGASGEGLFKMDIQGRKGYSITRFAIKDPKTFAIEYTSILGTYPSRGEVRSNGGKVAFRDDEAPGNKPSWVPVAKSRLPFHLTGAPLVAAFPSQFPRLVFSPLVTKKAILADYVASAIKQGYTVSVAEQKAYAQGREVKSHRVTLVNSKASQARNGMVRVDLVFNQNFGLPVTVYSTVQPKVGKRTLFTWTMAYKNATTYAAGQFKIPGLAP